MPDVSDDHAAADHAVLLSPGAAAEAPASSRSEQAETARSPRLQPAAAAFAALFIFVLAAVLLSPFWAPALMPLLPWAQKPEADKYNGLAARLTALEERPIIPPADMDAIKSAQAELTQRITALENAVSALRQGEGVAETKAALAQLTQRLDALAALSSNRAAAATAGIDKIREELRQRATAWAELSNRLDTLENQFRAQTSVDRSGSVLLLALLQMREAVQAARPFPAEYATFKELAARDPKLVAAAEPLAVAAHDGVASRAVLRQRLDELADHIATAKPPAAKPKWWTRALDQLSGLVTIRRIDGGGGTGPWTTIDAARTNLAQGDLAAAVMALEKLAGANAEAAQPWLRMARQRLAAETALTQLQEGLTARLGSPPSTTPAPTAPAPSSAAPPGRPPAAAKTPS